MSYRSDFHDILFSEIDNEERDARLHYIARNSIPKSLYRFRSFSEFELDALMNNRVYLNSPKNFNDPYDSLPFCRNQSDIGYLSFNEEHLKEQHEDLIEKSQNTVSVACFTENIESQLLWAHYANSHKGFVLEYDLRKTDIQIYGHREIREYSSKTVDKRQTDGKIFPVVYTNKRVDATEHIKILHDSEYIHRNLGSRFQLDHVLSKSHSYMQIILSKHKDWEYENEWRIICVHFDMLKIYAALKPKAIIYGSAISPVHRKLLSYIAKENRIIEKEAVIPNDCDEFTIRINKVH